MEKDVRTTYYILTMYDHSKPKDLVRSGGTGYYSHQGTEETSHQMETTDIENIKKEMIRRYEENIKRLKEGEHPECMIEVLFKERCWEDDYEYKDTCG